MSFESIAFPWAGFIALFAGKTSAKEDPPKEVPEDSGKKVVETATNSSSRAFPSNHKAAIFTAIVTTLVILALLATAATGGAGWLGGTAFAKANLSFLHLDKLNAFLTQFNSWLPEALAGGGIAGFFGVLGTGGVTLAVRALIRDPNIDTDVSKRTDAPKTLSPAVQALVKPVGELLLTDYPDYFDTDRKQAIEGVSNAIPPKIVEYMYENKLTYFHPLQDGFLVFTPLWQQFDKSSPRKYYLEANPKPLRFEDAKQTIPSTHSVIKCYTLNKFLEVVQEQQNGEGKQEE